MSGHSMVTNTSQHRSYARLRNAHLLQKLKVAVFQAATFLYLTFEVTSAGGTCS